jgi:hypothetical protein
VSEDKDSDMGKSRQPNRRETPEQRNANRTRTKYMGTGHKLVYGRSSVCKLQGQGEVEEGDGKVQEGGEQGKERGKGARVEGPNVA